MNKEKIINFFNKIIKQLDVEEIDDPEDLFVDLTEHIDFMKEAVEFLKNN